MIAAGVAASGESVEQQRKGERSEEQTEPNSYTKGDPDQHESRVSPRISWRHYVSLSSEKDWHRTITFWADMDQVLAPALESGLTSCRSAATALTWLLLSPAPHPPFAGCTGLLASLAIHAGRG